MISHGSRQAILIEAGLGTKTEISQTIILLQKLCSVGHATRFRRRPLEDADREILETANRIYTLTEPMIRSVLAPNLLAEFPSDFSGNETRVIPHFGTYL